LVPSLIAILILGISIGTGLLFESGWTLNVGGPVSLLLAYICMGTVLYAVMVYLSLDLANYIRGHSESRLRSCQFQVQFSQCRIALSSKHLYTSSRTMLIPGIRMWLFILVCLRDRLPQQDRFSSKFHGILVRLESRHLHDDFPHFPNRLQSAQRQEIR